MARIWIDALTPKQARLAAHLYNVLSEKGYEVLVTIREYDLTRYVLDRLGVSYVTVGWHGGLELRSKLVADLERGLRLVEIVSRFKPDWLVAYPSPSALRVAFGLGIKSIVISDSPHSIPAHLLTVPLADYLVHSSLIPSQLFERYASFKTRIVTYFGVDEIGWIRGHRCREDVLSELGVEPYKYVVVRLAEWKAEYYRGREKPPLLELVKLLASRGLYVIVIPRYEEDYEMVKRLAERYEKLRVVWGSAVDSADLYCWSRLVITGGATMAREAALMCKTAVSLYPTLLNKVLEQLGFPIIHPEGGADVLTRLVLNLLEEPRECSERAKRLLEDFETPGDAVARLIAGQE